MIWSTNYPMNDMLMHSNFRQCRAVAVVFIVVCVLVISWSLLPHESWATSSFKISHSPTSNDQSTAQISPLPPAYSQTVPKLSDCEKQLGTSFILDASNTSVKHCSDASLSSLTCFRTHTSTERIDSFCVGTPAVSARKEKKFKLGCALSDLTEQQVAAGVPPFAQFPAYWYETGPRTIFSRHVKLDPGEIVESDHISSPKNYTILVRREGPSPMNNLFHHFMQIFSVFLTLDVLQIAIDPATGNPFFRAEEIENTRVIIFDEFVEGPFYDQWTPFAKRPLMRIQTYRLVHHLTQRTS